MKRILAIGLALVFVFVAASLSFAAVVNGKIDVKKGDEVYVCGCEKCPCMTMSRSAGKCSCGKDLVKGTVAKVEKGKAYVMVDGKEKAFKTTGKYVCPCGAGCPCDTISQKPGKCGCGKDLMPVKSSKSAM